MSADNEYKTIFAKGKHFRPLEVEDEFAHISIDQGDNFTYNYLNCSLMKLKQMLITRVHDDIYNCRLGNLLQDCLPRLPDKSLTYHTNGFGKYIGNPIQPPENGEHEWIVTDRTNPLWNNKQVEKTSKYGFISKRENLNGNLEKAHKIEEVISKHIQENQHDLYISMFAEIENNVNEIIMKYMKKLTLPMKIYDEYRLQKELNKLQ